MSEIHPYIELVTRYDDEVVAVLTWKAAGDGRSELCVVDGAVIGRPIADRTAVAVLIEGHRGGRVRAYRFPDVATAFWSLGMSAHVCDGVDGWRGPGTTELH